MPAPFYALIEFIFLGVLVIGSLFMGTGPMRDQARSAHEISRAENHMPI